MRVKYAAGIVKNRVTADRRVTCAIEHVGSIPSFHRSAHLVTPPPLLLVFPFFRLFFRPPPSKFPAHVSRSSRSPPLLHLFPFSFRLSTATMGERESLERARAREERREESGETGERVCQRFWHESQSTRVLLGRPLPRSSGALLLALRKREAAIVRLLVFSPLGTVSSKHDRRTKNLANFPPLESILPSSRTGGTRGCP